MSASPMPSRLNGTLETLGRTEKTDLWRRSFPSSPRSHSGPLTDLISKFHSSVATRETFPVFLFTPHRSDLREPARECAF